MDNHQDKREAISTAGRNISIALRDAADQLNRAKGAKAIVENEVMRNIDELEQKWDRLLKEDECNADDHCVALNVIAEFRDRMANLAKAATANIGVANGQLIGLSRAVSALEQQLAAIEAEEKAAQGPAPAHPGPGIAAMRKAEAAESPEAKSAKPALAAVPAQPDAEQEPIAEALAAELPRQDAPKAVARFASRASKRKS